MIVIFLYLVVYWHKNHQILKILWLEIEKVNMECMLSDFAKFVGHIFKKV